MNYGEILDRVEVLSFGTSSVDTDIRALLTGTYGIISNVHRMLQTDFDFWFMKAHSSFMVTADQQSYTLPVDTNGDLSFKREKIIQFLINGQTYYSEPLTKVTGSEAQHQLWVQNNQTAEYPIHYEIGEGILNKLEQETQMQVRQYEQIDVYEQMKEQIEIYENSIVQKSAPALKEETDKQKKQDDAEDKTKRKVFDTEPTKIDLAVARAQRLLSEHKTFASLSNNKFNQYMTAAEDYMKQGKYYKAAKYQCLGATAESRHQ